MEPDNAIEVHHLSKKFARSLKRAMWYGLVDISRMALMPHRYRSSGLSARLADASAPDAVPAHDPDLRPSEFWALRDVSLQIRRGESVGIIGHNGAGKSTLFSILSGIYGPTEGHVAVRGRLQALIALGAGFHPALSGRENIYINASILGLSRREIDQRFDRIVEFSELEAFLDAPVKNYSSGMLVRLGFSVAAHLDPDILLIDEVLAVGDMAFQRKCLNRMRELLDRKVTVVMVSHVLQSIEAICEQGVWLERGCVRGKGEARSVIQSYVNDQLQQAAQREQRAIGAPVVEQEDPVTIHRVEVCRSNGAATEVLAAGEPFRVRIHYEARERVETPYFHLVFFCGTTRVFDASMLIDGQAPPSLQGTGVLECTIPNSPLMPNVYRIHAHVRTREATVDALTRMQTHVFTVTAVSPGGTPAPNAVSMQVRGGLVRVPYQWQFVEQSPFGGVEP